MYIYIYIQLCIPWKIPIFLGNPCKIPRTSTIGSSWDVGSSFRLPMTRRWIELLIRSTDLAELSVETTPSSEAKRYYIYIYMGKLQYLGVSENSVPLNPMVLLIIIPIKWLFHWEYTLFSDKPISLTWMKAHLGMISLK